MEKERILEKVKKCLAMAKGKNANPNEAETALRQAHKLMEAYNLELGDVMASMACESGVAAGSTGKPPAWRVRLGQICADAFSTQLIIQTSPIKDAFFTYIGCAAAPELSGYAYQVLERQLQKARRDYLATQKRCKRSTKIARGDAFAHAWIDAVRAKVDEFSGISDNVADSIQAYMLKHFPSATKTELKRKQVKARDDSASLAGYQAGKSAQLHQAVSRNPSDHLTKEVY